MFLIAEGVLCLCCFDKRFSLGDLYEIGFLCGRIVGAPGVVLRLGRHFDRHRFAFGRDLFQCHDAGVGVYRGIGFITRVKQHILDVSLF